jgi:O-antigen/teichoic acid export membrane protein
MLFKNTLAQSTSLIAGYLFSFLLAPLMISRLGLDKFGVWAVTGAFASYAGLLDLGIGRSLTRFIAIFDTRGEEGKIRECLGLGLIAVTVVGVVALPVVAAGASFLSDKIGILDTEQMRIVVMSSVSIWTFNGYQGVLNGLGIGKRQMVPPNVASTIGVTVNFAFSVAALLASTSLVVYALANAAAALVSIVPCFIAMRRLWARPYWALPSRALSREVLGYSIKTQVGWLAELVNLQTDKVVIALAVDVRAAAVYEIASRVVLAVRAVAILSVSAIVPTAAAQIASEGRQVIGEMYRRYTLRSCAVAFPLFMLAAVGAPFLLVAWLGKAPGESELLVPFLTLAYLVNVSTGAGSTLALSAGHPGLVSSNSALIAVLNVALTVALAPVFGIWGVVGGTFLAITLGNLLLSGRILRLFGLPRRDFLRGVLPTGALAIGLAVPSAVLALVVGAPDARPIALLLLAVSASIYLLPYWLLASRWGYLPEKLRFPPTGPTAPAPSP